MAETPRAGFLASLRGGYADVRSSLERQLSEGIGEERLLAYVAYVALVGAVAQVPASIRAVQAAGDDTVFAGVVFGSFFATLFFAPLFLYGVAALSHIAARILGGQGSYFSARAGLFWSMVLASPLILLNSLLTTALFAASADVAGALAPVQGFAVFGIWAWIWAACLVPAEGLRRRGHNFAVVILFTAAFFALAVAL